MKLELSVSEAKELINSLHEPKELFEMLRSDVKDTVGKYLSELMDIELTAFLGREKHERIAGVNGDINYRNGKYNRKYTFKGFGEVDISVPRDRQGLYKTRIIEKGRRYEQALSDDLSLMFLSGISTRNLSLLSQRLLGRKISHSEISNINKEISEAAEQWRVRDLSSEKIKYLFIDGVNFKMRVTNTIELVPVLVVVGVREDNTKVVLSMQAGDKESASNWREFFVDLKRRCLNPEYVKLGIMDGLPGLEKVFSEEFINANIQRCQVHVARNILSKVPRKLQQMVADDVRSIFYASSKKKALEFYNKFKNTWETQLPSAVKCLSNSLESCLSFYKFPSEEWVSLRTTNAIERLNKEFKRRTKTMEIVPSEEACYRLLAFICIKMEIHWKTHPLGKVQKIIPLFNNISK